MNEGLRGERGTDPDQSVDAGKQAAPGPAGEAPTEVIPAGVSLFARPGSSARPPVDDAATAEIPAGALQAKPPGRAPAAPAASPVPPDESPTAVILNVSPSAPPPAPAPADRSDRPTPVWRRLPVLAGAAAVVALAVLIGVLVTSGSDGPPAVVAASFAPKPSPLGFSLKPEPGAPTANPSGKRSSAAPTKGATTPAGGPARGNPDGTNLALRRPVTASSSEGDAFPASAAVDGDPKTRWSSAFSDPQWIVVDLGSPYQVSQVRLVWEKAYATIYEVDLSLDGTRWSAVFATNNGTGGTVDVDAGSYPARYIRMKGTGRSGGYGYSLYEIEVR